MSLDKLVLGPTQDDLNHMHRKQDYDVYYFIQFFAAIPDSRWTTGAFEEEDRHCAGGHCGMRQNHAFPPKYQSLICLLGLDCTGINDGRDPRYQQSTPKRRILAALRDVASM